MEVLKTTSPSVVPSCPKARPVKTVPSSRASLATLCGRASVICGAFWAFIGRDYRGGDEMDEMRITKRVAGLGGRDSPVVDAPPVCRVRPEGACVWRPE